jgi:hypothetical protein
VTEKERWKHIDEVVDDAPRGRLRVLEKLHSANRKSEGEQHPEASRKKEILEKIRIGGAESAQEEAFTTATDEEKQSSDKDGNGSNKRRRLQEVQEIIREEIDIEGVHVCGEIRETACNEQNNQDFRNNGQYRRQTHLDLFEAMNLLRA